MKKVINNNNGTITIVMSKWSVTATPVQLEEIWNKCYNESIANLLKKVNEQNI